MSAWALPWSIAMIMVPLLVRLMCSGWRYHMPKQPRQAADLTNADLDLLCRKALEWTFSSRTEYHKWKAGLHLVMARSCWGHCQAVEIETTFHSWGDWISLASVNCQIVFISMNLSKLGRLAIKARIDRQLGDRSSCALTLVRLIYHILDLQVVIRRLICRYLEQYWLPPCWSCRFDWCVASGTDRYPRILGLVKCGIFHRVYTLADAANFLDKNPCE